MSCDPHLKLSVRQLGKCHVAQHKGQASAENPWQDFTPLPSEACSISGQGVTHRACRLVTTQGLSVASLLVFENNSTVVVVRMASPLLRTIKDRKEKGVMGRPRGFQMAKASRFLTTQIRRLNSKSTEMWNQSPACEISKGPQAANMVQREEQSSR